ncbi:MAG TPA: VOC family protein [Bacteroidota bacterium]
MKILGLHHITMVSANAQRTVDFYAAVLGFRFVKRTVNFDDPESYHLYFGDSVGNPGTLLTFFEWRHLPPGQWGIGTTHHLALLVETEEAQLKWKRWLTDHGVSVTGPYDRRYFRSIYFTDPDGIILEIATRGSGFSIDREDLPAGSREPPRELTREGRDEKRAVNWPERVESLTPDMALGGLHHITAIASDIGRTSAFYQETLGFLLVKRTFNFDDPLAPHYYFSATDGSPRTLVTYFGYDESRMRWGRMGAGLTHHFAFAVLDDDAQVEWRDRLLRSGLDVTPVLNRTYFKSIYFKDPDGHILEIATLGPGFLLDEEEDALGSRLALPSWLEHRRADIEASLAPLTVHTP